jgi:hypothetical protein
VTTFDEPIAIELGDPEPLRQALLVAMERVSDVVVRLEPQQPHMEEGKGLLGHKKTIERMVGPEIIYFADEHGAGVFSLNMFHPPGWPAALGTPVPAGSHLTIQDATYYSFDLDPASSPAKAAADIMGLTAFVFAEQLGTSWKISVNELSTGVGD